MIKKEDFYISIRKKKHIRELEEEYFKIEVKKK